MTDKQEVVEESEVEETTQDSSPQSEDQTIEDQTPQDTEPEVQEETEEVSDSPDVEEIMSEDQRKAFQRMRLENKKLKEEIEAKQKSESAFDVFKPKSQPGQIDINSYVDSNTGQVDWVSYNQAVVNQAQAAASQTVSEQLDEQRARDKYPEVFANPKLEQAIAGQWMANKLQGKDISIESLAQDFSSLVKGEVTKAERKAEKRGAEQALNELTPKEQASLKAQSQTTSQNRQATSAEDEQELLNKARFGDQDSITELVSGVAWKK